MALQMGDKIPEILGIDQNGEEIKSSAYRGEKIVIYFYPKDSTPGCTAEACSLRDNYDTLQKMGYRIIGVSTDSVESHKKFIEKQQLPFTLIADISKILVNEFGVWGEKQFMGKTYMGINRTTFLVDENGFIEKIIGPKEIKTKEHAQQIINLK